MASKGDKAVVVAGSALLLALMIASLPAAKKK